MKEFVLCSCNHADHLLIINYNEEKDYADCSIEIHLSPLPFFQRLIRAFKYVFGYRSRYGDYEEMVIDRERALKIKNFLDNAIGKENFK